MTTPRNIFTDFQDYISNATFRARSSIYGSFKDLTKDFHNPLISVEQYVSKAYDNSVEVIQQSEQHNLVPAFWVTTLGTIATFKILPRFKFIGWLALTGAIGSAYFPKSIENAYKNLVNK